MNRFPNSANRSLATYLVFTLLACLVAATQLGWVPLIAWCISTVVVVSFYRGLNGRQNRQKCQQK